MKIQSSSPDKPELKPLAQAIKDLNPALLEQNIEQTALFTETALGEKAEEKITKKAFSKEKKPRAPTKPKAVKEVSEKPKRAPRKKKSAVEEQASDALSLKETNPDNLENSPTPLLEELTEQALQVQAPLDSPVQATPSVVVPQSKESGSVKNPSEVKEQVFSNTEPLADNAIVVEKSSLGEYAQLLPQNESVAQAEEPLLESENTTIQAIAKEVLQESIAVKADSEIEANPSDEILNSTVQEQVSNVEQILDEKLYVIRKALLHEIGEDILQVEKTLWGGLKVKGQAAVKKDSIILRSVEPLGQVNGQDFYDVQVLTQEQAKSLLGEEFFGTIGFEEQEVKFKGNLS